MEDNRDGADSLAALLTLDGYHIEVAYDGMKAVRTLETSHFDVVLCDIGLPGKSGYEVAREVRRLQAAHPLLVAISAYSSPVVQQHCRDAGFDFFIAKPADPRAIEQLLQNYETASQTELDVTPPE